MSQNKYYSQYNMYIPRVIRYGGYILLVLSRGVTIFSKSCWRQPCKNVNFGRSNSPRVVQEKKAPKMVIFSSIKTMKPVKLPCEILDCFYGKSPLPGAGGYNNVWYNRAVNFPWGNSLWPISGLTGYTCIRDIYCKLHRLGHYNFVGTVYCKLHRLCYYAFW